MKPVPVGSWARPANVAPEHPAGIWKRESEELLVSDRSSRDGLGRASEDDAAEVTAEGADGLVVFLAFGALFLVVALRLRDPFAMVIDGGHHRRLGPRALTCFGALEPRCLPEL